MLCCTCASSQWAVKNARRPPPPWCPRRRPPPPLWGVCCVPPSLAPPPRLSRLLPPPRPPPRRPECRRLPPLPEGVWSPRCCCIVIRGCCCPGLRFVVDSCVTQRSHEVNVHAYTSMHTLSTERGLLVQRGWTSAAWKCQDSCCARSRVVDMLPCGIRRFKRSGAWSNLAGAQDPTVLRVGGKRQV